ncbi:MAG: hypothetical protein Q9162_002835, partial [Coniocarpon cinnabarinum]
MSRERRPRYDHTLRPPRGAASRSPSPASSVSSTEASTSASERESDSSCTTDFDDLYDVSDDDSAVVPIKCSNSIKALLTKNDLRRESLPSLVIPSPSAWPTIEKFKAAKEPDIPPVPAKFPLSPAALEKLATQHLRVPGVNSTPSLDGASSNSDEPASISPSTPELEARARDMDWDPPVQLTEQAMDTLHHLSPEFEAGEQGTIISAAPSEPNEMEERGLNISLMAPPSQPGLPNPPKLAIKLPPSEPISAISVPSPGGFFAGLDCTSKRTWSWNKLPGHQPSTTTAECFYDVPWDNHISEIQERVLEIKKEDEEGSEGPPTARQEQFTGRQSEEEAGPHEMIIRGDRNYDYDEEYQKKLFAVATSNASRTSMWLNAQDQYLSALRGANPLNAHVTDRGSPLLSSPSDFASDGAAAFSKKVVRFVEPTKPNTPLTALRIPITAPGASDPLFYHAFQHLLLHARPIDAHTMRYLRADAIHAQRLYITDVHYAQLRGIYSIPAPPIPDKDWCHLPEAPNDPATQKRREDIARVERERKAVQQVSLSIWHLEATKFLTGGSLLPRSTTSPLDSARNAGRTPRILDLGGLPTADWGWAIALEHRDLRVYTAVVSPPPDPGTDGDDSGEPPAHWSTHRTPSNHRVLTVSRPYRLPFPSGSFDLVSARTLATLCRTSRPKAPSSPPHGGPTDATKSPFDEFDFPFASDFGVNSSPDNRGAFPSPNGGVEKYSDEFAATLAEVKRVLAPGGVLSYEYLDAEVVPSTSSPVAPDPSINQKEPDIVLSGSSRDTTRQREKAKSLHARSVEFAVSLRQQGHDPSPGHRSIPRLLEAGFKRENIRETTVELPIGGSDDGVGAISEVVG